MISFSNNLQLELGLLESMAGPRLSQSCGHSRWKQVEEIIAVVRRYCCYLWHVLFTLSFGIIFAVTW